jgi:hypothetical protein
MPEANPRTEALFWSALAIASPHVAKDKGIDHVEDTEGDDGQGSRHPRGSLGPGRERFASCRARKKTPEKRVPIAGAVVPFG